MELEGRWHVIGCQKAIASTNLEGHQNSPIFEDVVVSSFAYVLVQGDELEFGE